MTTARKLRMAMTVSVTVAVVAGLYLFKCWQVGQWAKRSNARQVSWFLTPSFKGEFHFHAHYYHFGMQVGPSFYDNKSDPDPPIFICVHPWKKMVREKVGPHGTAPLVFTDEYNDQRPFDVSDIIVHEIETTNCHFSIKQLEGFEYGWGEWFDY